MSRRAKGAEREEAVLRAAGQAISEIGLANVRVSDIADRANMTSGHVTYYFPSKDELLMRAIRRSEEQLVLESRAELSAIVDPVQRLLRLIDLAASNGPGDSGWNLWLQVWARGVSDDAVSGEHRSLDQRWFELLTETVAYGSAQGAFRVDSVADAAETLSAVIDGLSVQLTVGSPRLDRQRVVRLCVAGAAAVLHLA